MGEVLSAIDIGSNTAHLLVAEHVTGGLRRISDANEWLNLGEVVAGRGEIPIPLQDQLVETLQRFKSQAKADRASRMYVFATEAMRSAHNSKRVLRRIKSEAKLDVELVPAQREAELGLRGVLLDSDASDAMVVAEVGGGSAQVAFAEEGRLREDTSLPLGTGTLQAAHPISFPCRPERLEALSQAIRTEISRVPDHADVEQVVASGGVARGIWRALHPDGEREIANEELEYMIWATQRLTVDEIGARFLVKPRRAATLLPGAIIYREILRRYNKEKMLVSRFGVREGAVLDMAGGKIAGCPL